MTGLPQNEAKVVVTFFEVLYSNSDRLEGIYLAHEWNSNRKFCLRHLVSKYKTLIDVGGSAELLSLMVAKHQAHEFTTWDLPPVTHLLPMQQYNKFQLGDRVKSAKGTSLMM
jgi:hypothetical protein